MRLLVVIAVGMPVTQHPPHRSGLALLTHPALTSDVWRHCYTREVGHFTDRKDPEAERAKELARMLDKPGGTVQ